MEKILCEIEPNEKKSNKAFSLLYQKSKHPIPIKIPNTHRFFSLFLKELISKFVQYIPRNVFQVKRFSLQLNKQFARLQNELKAEFTALELLLKYLYFHVKQYLNTNVKAYV